MQEVLNYLLSFAPIHWVIEHFFLLVSSIFAVLLIAVRLANHKLPSRDDIALEFYHNQQLGDNNKIWRLFSKFRHNDSPAHLNKSPLTNDTLADNNFATTQLSGIHALPDGEKAFTARIILTQLAQTSLDLQYYMWHDDASGRLLFYEVWKSAERGVKVRILLDDNNTAGMDAVLQTLDRHPNISVRLFNPFMNRRFRLLGYATALKRLNHRMHNKSFTVDNQVSIFGGRNIGDEYFDADEQMNFADLDVMALGHVVGEISQDFDRYWNCDASFPIAKIVTKTHEPVDLSKTADEKYQVSTENYQRSLGKSDFYQNLDVGSVVFEWVKVKFVSDSPAKVLNKHEKGDILIDQIYDTLTTPKHSLTIVSPYFVPMKKWTNAFVNLANKGIEVNILTNSLTSNDVLAVHAGYMQYRKPLLEGKVKLYELKSRLHSRSKAPVNAENKPMLTGSLMGGSGAMGSNAKGGANKNPHRTEENPFTASRKQNRKHKHRQGKRNKAHLIRNAGSSLHAKTFSVDGEKIFVGSFNFDPRSALLNTEMGAVIYSTVLAKQLDDTIERWTNELSYVVTLENGKIGWSDNSNHPATIFKGEPESNWRQRLLVWVISKLPIEDFL